MPRLHPKLILLFLAAACVPDAKLEDERLEDMNMPPIGGAGSPPPASSPPSAPHSEPPATAATLPTDDGAPPVLGALAVKQATCVQVEMAVNKLAEVTMIFDHAGQ